MQMRVDAGGEPDLPEVPLECLYMIRHLFEAGPFAAGGMAPAPVTWTEIEAWQRCTGIPLSPWESQLLRRMSAEYMTEYQAATAHDAPPPWVPHASPERRALISNHIKTLFRG